MSFQTKRVPERYSTTTNKIKTYVVDEHDTLGTVLKKITENKCQAINEGAVDFTKKRLGATIKINNEKPATIALSYKTSNGKLTSYDIVSKKQNSELLFFTIHVDALPLLAKEYEYKITRINYQHVKEDNNKKIATISEDVIKPWGIYSTQTGNPTKYFMPQKDGFLIAATPKNYFLNYLFARKQQTRTLTVQNFKDATETVSALFKEYYDKYDMPGKFLEFMGCDQQAAWKLFKAMVEATENEDLKKWAAKDKLPPKKLTDQAFNEYKEAEKKVFQALPQNILNKQEMEKFRTLVTKYRAYRLCKPEARYKISEIPVSYIIHDAIPVWLEDRNMKTADINDVLKELRDALAFEVNTFDFETMFSDVTALMNEGAYTVDQGTKTLYKATEERVISVSLNIDKYGNLTEFKMFLRLMADKKELISHLYTIKLEPLNNGKYRLKRIIIETNEPRKKTFWNRSPYSKIKREDVIDDEKNQARSSIYFNGKSPSDRYDDCTKTFSLDKNGVFELVSVWSKLESNWY